MSTDRRNRPPLPAPLGSVLAPVYQAVVTQRNRKFDSGKHIQRASVPVISVGNLSVGGTGKTPVVTTIVRILIEHNHRPGIAMRGYKARPGEPSDEQAEYTEALPGIPVVAQPDRVEGARLLTSTHNCSCIVLDDGFQHRFLARDLDIVLIDATRSVFNDHCLPKGWLREPVSSLSRAGAILITHAESASPQQLESLRRELSSLTTCPIAITQHTWSGVHRADSSHESLETLQSLRAVLASGIGNPTAFEHMAQSRGVRIESHKIHPDHHHWTAQDLDHLDTLRQGLPVLTTRKDWVKIRRLDHPIKPHILVPQLSIAFRTGEDTFRQMLLATARGA